jgi:hypothetical protein
MKINIATPKFRHIPDLRARVRAKKEGNHYTGLRARDPNQKGGFHDPSFTI